ncbi:MAG: DUF5011 domain-containing protein, partial [Candidatus Hydrogenedentes bacterium]|nr:DUF5011 domain-containing protein [Candidatus Hydrogenedentota bacterium]
YLFTYVTSDNSGNIATEVTRIVHVVDTAAPVIALNGDPEVSVECGTPYQDAGATALDQCEGDVPVDVSVEEIINGPAKAAAVDTSHVADYLLTYTAQDSAGNAAAPVTRVVHVVDTTPPVLTLLGDPEVTVECGTPYEDAGAEGLDVCEGLTHVFCFVGTPGGKGAAGDGCTIDTSFEAEYIFTYVTSDNAGNIATEVTRIVHVVDTTAPVIALNGDPEVTVECSTEYVDAGATALDQCDGDVPVDVTVEEIITKAASASVDTSHVADYLLTYTAQDSAGNAALPVTRLVHVVDTTPPVLTLLGDPEITVECGTPFTDPGAEGLDACEGPTHVFCFVTDTGVKGTTGDECVIDTSFRGDYIFTYVTSDNSGNIAPEVTRIVHVVDTTPPVITLIGDADMTAECNTPFDDPGATADDICDGPVNVVATQEGPLVTKTPFTEPGLFTITYTAQDSSGNQATPVVRTVTVVDTTPPTLTVLGEDFVMVECGDPFTDPGATPDDSCDPNPQVQIGGDTVNPNEPGTYEINYQAFDASGNSSSMDFRIVFVQDTQPPVITLLGDPEMTIECPAPFVDPGATATDVCDGDVPVEASVEEIVVKASTAVIDTSHTGEYVITYTATDSHSNSATPVTRTVHVVDTTPPVITLNGNAEETVECGQPYSDAGATASDDCDGDLTSAIVDEGGVNTSVPADYTLSFDVTDSTGNAAATVTRTVHVVDTTPPVISLLGGDMTIFCGQDFNDPGATAFDDCEGDLTSAIVVGGDAVDTGTPGNYLITYDVSDSVPNAATQVTRAVTVEGPCGGDGLACPDLGNMVGTCVFFADFETDDNGFTPAGLWHRTGVCPALLHPDAPTMVQYFGDDSTCTYATGSQVLGALTSGLIDLSAFLGGAATLRFDYILETEGYAGYDKGLVEISNDGGATFTELTGNDVTTDPLCDEKCGYCSSDSEKKTVLASEGEFLCSTSLDGTQEVPSNASTATGSATFVRLPNNMIRLTVTHDVVDPTGAHIHSGDVGVNGPIIIALGDSTSPITFDLTPDQYATIIATPHYINVHSATFPGGEIRGQITGCSPCEPLAW